MINASDKCTNCGHVRKRHVSDNGHVQCTTICNCTKFGEPKDVYEEIVKAAEEGHAAAQARLQAANGDPVNHPTHYTVYPGIEIIQLTRHMNFNRGNAVKYVARAGLKSQTTEIQDLEKAIWYLKDEIAMLKGEYNV